MITKELIMQKAQEYDVALSEKAISDILSCITLELDEPEKVLDETLYREACYLRKELATRPQVCYHNIME